MSNYLERRTLSNLTHMMSIIDLVTNNVESPSTDSEYSLEKEFIKLVCMNPQMALNLIANFFIHVTVV